MTTPEPDTTVTARTGTPRTGTPKGLRPEVDLSKWIWFVPAIALVLCILPFDDDFEETLRWVIAGPAAFLAWKEYDLNGRAANSYTWIFGAVAVLFNPLIPVHLFGLLWIALYIGGAAVFVGHYQLRRQGS